MGLAFLVVIGVSAALVLMYLLTSRSWRDGQALSFAPLMAVVAIATVMFLTTAYHVAAYAGVPVDLVSFSEAPFVNDILKVRIGQPIYTPPQDNNSYPYTPGTQLLTYLVSDALGHGDSISFLRHIQMWYVILAAVFATWTCHLLASMTSPNEYRQRPLWIAIWFPLLFLVAFDERFNEYVHSLHNDGLALLVCSIAFWLMVKYSMSASLGILCVMALVPSLGFFVKQSQAIWFGLLTIYLVADGKTSWPRLSFFATASLLALMSTVGGCYLLWGADFWFWVFEALGQKSVSIARSIEHLLEAGLYAVMALFGGWVLVLRDGTRSARALWLCWLILFSAEVYTSGLGWHTNHIGPGVLIGSCWFLASLTRVWPAANSREPWWQNRAQEWSAVCAVVLLFGTLGHVRPPLNPVPKDLERYVADIEREFQGIPADSVLMDTGNWPYLRENVLMKDRSETIGIWLGANEAQLDRSKLAGTIERIEQQIYQKVLARQIDTEHTWYDFQNIGSGVRDAILNNYTEVRRIPAVEVQGGRWLPHLVSEIVVLVPNRDDREGYRE